MKLGLFFITALIFIHLNAYSETEPNNTMQQANNLSYNGNESGTLSGTDIEDWFVINIPQGGIFTLTVKKTGAGNGNMFLIDGEKPGYPEITNLYIANGDSPEKGWTLTVPVLGGKYYVKFLRNSEPFNYQITASLALPSFIEDREPNDTISTALSMPVNGSVSGSLHYYGAGKGVDQRDWYKIDIKQGGILSLKIIKKGGGNSWLSFRDGKMTGNPQLSSFYFEFWESNAEGWSWSYPVLAGVYYFQIEGGSGIVDYKLDVSLTPPSYAEDAEPNDTVTKALIMPVSGSVSGNLHYYMDGKGVDVQDWYKLEIPRGGILNLRIYKKGTGNSWLRFRDGLRPGFTEITSFYFEFWESSAEGMTWSYPVLAGVYFFQVEGGGGIVDYKLDVNLVSPSFPEDKEPNDTVTKAVIMPVSGSVSGNVHYYVDGKGPDVQDWYKLVVPAGGILNLKIHKKGTGNSWLRFRDGQKPGFPELTSFYFDYWESPADGTNWSYPVLAGTYYFQVDGGGYPLDYKLDIQLKLPVWGEDTEPNDSLKFAKSFSVNDSVSGLVGYYKPGTGFDDWDWFVLKTPEYGNLSFNVDKKGIYNGNIRLRDSINEIASQYLDFGDLNVKWGKLVPAGKYYLGFQKYDGDFQYKVRMKLTPRPKAGFSVSRTDHEFTFENTTLFGETYAWNFDDGAKSTAVNPSHEFLKPGNYDVCMITKNIAGSDTVCNRQIIPGIDRIYPAQGGNTGDVTIEVFGGGLDTGYVATINKGTTIISASNFTGIPSKSSISLSFDLRNKSQGTFDLVIGKKGGPSYKMTDGFRIVPGVKANPWVNVSGRNRILFNTWTTFTVNFGNTGNVDAVMVPVWLTFSKNPGLDIDFTDVFFTNPDSTATVSGYEGIYTDLDSLFGKPGPTRVYPLIIPIIPASSVNTFKIRIKTSDHLNINAWTEKPWVQSPTDINKSQYMKGMDYSAPIEDASLNKFKAQCIAGIANSAPVSNKPPLDCFLDKFLPAVALEFFDAQTKAHEKGEEILNDGNYHLYFVSFVKALSRVLKICGVKNKGDLALINYYIISNLADLSMAINNKTKSASIISEEPSCPDEFEPQNSQTLPVAAVSSLDPNEKSGPSGYGTENYIASGRNFPYIIYFENKATATAPAHIVSITDQLDKTKFDFASFSFGHISIGDSLIRPKTGIREFVLDKKLNKLKEVARISGKLDTLTGKLEWKLRSLDPVTLDDIEDPDVGLLPPNKSSPEGQGSVSFFVRLKSDPIHKLNVTNQASIVFDSNPAILTNRHLTTFDLVAPQSAVQSLVATTATRQFTVKWAGTDDGSGIDGYNVYVKNNNGPYNLWLAGTTATSAVYKSPADGTYQFSSAAIDKTGNMETLSDNPDATTNVVTAVDDNRMPDTEAVLYPTPSTQELIINIGVAGHFILRIYGTDGSLRIEKSMNGNSVSSIKTNSLPHGLYLWQLVNEEVTVKKTGKFVVNE